VSLIKRNSPLRRAGSFEALKLSLGGCLSCWALRGDAHGAEGLALVTFFEGAEEADGLTSLAALEGCDAVLHVGEDGGGALVALDAGEGEALAVAVVFDLHVGDEVTVDVVEFVSHNE